MLDKHNDDYQTLGVRYCITHEGIELLIKSLENLKKVFSEIAHRDGKKPEYTPNKG